ncbi:MAG: transcriptional repressor [Candidatus Krumholzibacteria bacterium]|nr:transcriptional repressor [Candidatus Krumholzibacteria bacterium]
MKMNVNFNNKRVLDDLSNCLAGKGLRFSRKRMEVIEHFIGSTRHYTVEQLYDEIRKTNPGIGYSTVYRALKLLAECGMAKVHHFNENETRYEPAGKNRDHDHLVCEECGRIIEFTSEGIEHLQRRIALENDFSARRHEFQIYGLCSKCRGKEGRTS